MSNFVFNLIKHKPIIAVFDVTKKCNSRCSMCNIWKLKSKDGLSLSDIKELFYKLKRNGFKIVLIQGGEPLLRKDIINIVLLAKKNGLIPIVVTNGLLLDKFADELGKIHCNISISLDSLTPNIYKKIRGIDALDRVLKNIDYALSVNKKARYFINSTFSRINAFEAIKIFDYASSRNIGFSAYPYNYNNCFISNKDEELCYNSSTLIHTFEELSSYAKKTRSCINHIIFNEVVSFLRGNYKKPCDAINYSVHIDEKGFLSPCIEMPGEIDLNKVSLNEAIAKLNYNKVRSCYLNTSCFYGCTRCFSCVKNNINILFKLFIHNPIKFKY